MNRVAVVMINNVVVCFCQHRA